MTQPQTPYPPPVPPQLPPPKKRRTGLIILSAFGVLFLIMFVGCMAVIGSSPDEQQVAPADAPAKKAAPPAEQKPEKIVFKVTGDAPRGVDITYGSDADDRSGNSGTDAYGMPTAELPWKESMKADANVMYYQVTAQLNGDGDIDCKIKVGGEVIDKGHASGDYNICIAEVAPGVFGGWDPY